MISFPIVVGGARCRQRDNDIAVQTVDLIRLGSVNLNFQLSFILNYIHASLSTLCLRVVNVECSMANRIFQAARADA